MKPNRNIPALILAVMLTLMLTSPELLSAIHHAQAHHHQGEHCEICVQLEALIMAKRQMGSGAILPVIAVLVFLLVHYLGGKKVGIFAETLVSLNVKQTN